MTLVIRNFNVTGEWKYAYFVLLFFVNVALM